MGQPNSFGPDSCLSSGRHQLPRYEPNSQALCDAPDGLVQSNPQPALTRISVAAWSLFDDLRLDEAKTQDFVSLRDCFVRELRDGARRSIPIPAWSRARATQSLEHSARSRKDRRFRRRAFRTVVKDLLGDERLVERHRDGKFVTLRLRASMYHRFHAPCDGRVRAREIHFRRYVERQSGRAQAGREALLQE